jgi:fibro-slime domain-containing protein
MVLQTLDIAGLPIGTSTYQYSWGIGKWYRPWPQGNEFLRPVYSQNGTDLVGVSTVPYDSSYKNMRITDSLTFNYVSGSEGIYEFGDTAFFPLDNRGFGNEGRIHNYSFTAMIHREIEYRQGLVLNFQSYGDMWVFINGHLVLDLGGIQSTVAGQFDLNNFAASLGLSPGDSAALDIFWAQRSGERSVVKADVNIVSVKPCLLYLPASPPSDTTIKFGDSLVLSVTLMGTCGETLTVADTLIHWKWTSAYPSTDTKLRSATGLTNTFYPASPGMWYTIIISCFPPTYQNLILLDTVRVYVQPPQPVYRLYIEPDTLNCSIGGDVTRCMNPSPLDSLVFSGTAVPKTAVAVLRDKYGNFVEHAPKSEWKFLSGSDIARMSFPVRPYLAVIEALKPGTAMIEVTDTTNNFTKKDTLKIIVKDDILSAMFERLSLRPIINNQKTVREFFNLRGQKLPLYGIRHADGIVLERVIEPTGKVIVRKKLVPKP